MPHLVISWTPSLRAKIRRRLKRAVSQERGRAKLVLWLNQYNIQILYIYPCIDSLSLWEQQVLDHS